MALPWFKVYAAELLSDERFASWTLEERGAWFTLISSAWREGSIPADLGQLARMLHVDSNRMTELWRAIGDRFVSHPDASGRLTSPRLEREREDAESLVEKKREAGKKGANSRWGKKNSGDSSAIATAIAKRSESAKSQSQSQSQIQSQPANARAPARAFAKRLGGLLGRNIAAGSREAQDVIGEQLAIRGEQQVAMLCLDFDSRATTPAQTLDFFVGWLKQEPEPDGRERVA